MPSPWGTLHGYLKRSVSTSQSRREFDQVRSRRPSLLSFADPWAVVTYARDQAGHLDEKDAIYADLVREAQTAPSDRLALHIIWLGLWPGLDGIFQCFVPGYGGRRDELVNTIVVGLEHAVRRVDLSKTSRLASTLVENCRRHVRRGRFAERWFAAPLPDGDEVADPATGDNDSERDDVVAFLAMLPPIANGIDTMASIRAWLEIVIGRDADLVVGVLEGVDQHEMAKRLGLTHEAARKRYQRALKRLGQEIVRNRQRTCPTSPKTTAFPLQSPEKGQPLTNAR